MGSRHALALTFAVGCGSAARPATPPAPHGQPVAVPGACVDPTTDANQRLAEVPDDGAVDSMMEMLPAPDVDGDGTPDRVFTAGLGVTSNALVYVVRGACAHFVGDVVQGPNADPAGTKHAGLFDLRVDENSMCEGSRCGCELGALWFRFDGTAYILDEAASKMSTEIACPDEE